jgi:hypothetical protein
MCRSELDAEAPFHASVQAPCGDRVESVDQLDGAVDVVEPLQLDAVGALPCRAHRHDRSMGFELAVEIASLTSYRTISASKPAIRASISQRLAGCLRRPMGPSLSWSC